MLAMGSSNQPLVHRLTFFMLDIVGNHFIASCSNLRNQVHRNK